MASMLNFQPLIAGNLVISSFRDELLTDRYVGWLNDPEVVRFSEQRHRLHTLESCTRYLEATRASHELFLAVEVVGGEMWHIGNLSVAFDLPNSSADLSIMIGDRRAWGKGYASLAWSALIRYLLDDMGLRRVTAGTMDVNEPMVRLMMRSNMQIDFVRHRHLLWEGREVGMVMASRFRASEADQNFSVEG